MRSIGGLGVRTVRRQPGRYALTTIGAALGVAVMFGVLVANASIDAGLERSLGPSSVPGVLVQPVGSYGTTVSTDLVDKAAKLPGVVRATGAARVNLKVGDVELMVRGLHTRPGPAEAEASRGPSRNVQFEGREPSGPDELSLSRARAGQLGVGVGDALDVVSRGGPTRLTVVRVIDVPDENGLVSAETAQRLLREGSVVHDVWVELAPGTVVADWMAAQGTALGEGVRLNPGAGDGLRSAVRVVQGGFGALGLMAAFVGAFLIYLTLSTSVLERTRTWGVLRAVGGSRRAVVAAVVGEAAAIGVVSTALGLVVGLGLAGGLLRFTGTLYRLPSTELTVSRGSVVLAVALGLLAPPIAALVPARRAARAEPVDAMRARHGDASPLGRMWLVGAALVLMGALFARGPAGSLAVRGAPLVFMLGAVLLVPVLLRPVAAVVGRVGARLVPGLGEVAVRHLVRERSTSSYTLGLVMVVVAMVFALAAVQGSIMKAMHEAFAARYGADVTVWAWNGMDPEVAAALQAAPGVDASTVYRSGNATVTAPITAQGELSIIEPASFFAIQGFPWKDGDDDTAHAALAEGGAVLVPEGFAVRAGLRRGGELSLQTISGPRPFRVAGIYATPEPGTRIIGGIADGERWFGAASPQGIEMRAADGVAPDALLAQARTIVGDRPGYFLNTTGGEEREAAARVERNFRPFLAVVLVAGIVGALGLANTLGTAVLRRTREIGVLRAVGIDRGALGGMVLVESLTLGAVALVLAVPLGWVLAAAVLRSTSSALGFVVELVMPWTVLPVLVGGVVLLSAVAAAAPARRIARLDPVVALRFD